MDLAITGGEVFISSVRDWAIKSHTDTNHFYDVSLPYSFHLDGVAREGRHYIELLKDDDVHKLSATTRRVNAICTCYTHDSVEDARRSYAQVLAATNLHIAEMTRAVTNYGRGRNRAERMPDFIYEEIRNTYDADYVKLCDRIANIKYSIFMESPMLNKYRGEHEEFITKVTNRHELLKPMIDKLTELVKI